jgi:23S rRNA-/tRNA-specific pseudouridylate synthase
MPNSTSQPNRTEKIERLNKFLAFQLGVSRRQADDLIAKQKVYINNQPAQLGARIGESDTITINNHIVGGRSSYTYLMLNKPINYVCSRKQQGKTPTIYSLLPDKFHNLKPQPDLRAFKKFSIGQASQIIKLEAPQEFVQSLYLYQKRSYLEV